MVKVMVERKLVVPMEQYKEEISLFVFHLSPSQLYIPILINPIQIHESRDKRFAAVEKLLAELVGAGVGVVCSE